MKTLFNMLKGKKSYIVATLMIALGIMNNDMQMVLQGLAVAGLRNAI